MTNAKRTYSLAAVGVLVVLVAVWAFASRTQTNPSSDAPQSVPQEAPQPATIAQVNGQPVHAVMSPILFSLDAPYRHSSGTAEFPLVTAVQFDKPQSKFFIVIAGCLFDPKGDFSYADGLKRWKGFKCCTANQSGSGPLGCGGPLNESVKEHPPEQQMVITLAGENSSSSREFHISTQLNGGELEFGFYRYRQNRVVLLYEGDAVKSVSFDAGGLGMQYVGALRVQFLTGDGGEEMVLAEYGPPPTYDPRDGEELHALRIGAGIELASPRTAFAGDVFLPVGFAANGMQTTSTTEFPPELRGKDVEVEVQGIVGFSAFSLDAGEKGGGGGIQDAAYRIDHVRKDRFIYSNKTSWFDCRLRMNGDADDLMILPVGSQRYVASMPADGRAMIDPRHAYRMSFKVPKDGIVHFDVADWGFHHTNKAKNTWDSTGVLFVRYLGVRG